LGNEQIEYMNLRINHLNEVYENLEKIDGFLGIPEMGERYKEHK
jgi:hypothetical protein